MRATTSETVSGKSSTFLYRNQLNLSLLPDRRTSGSSCRGQRSQNGEVASFAIWWTMPYTIAKMSCSGRVGAMITDIPVIKTPNSLSGVISLVHLPNITLALLEPLASVMHAITPFITQGAQNGPACCKPVPSIGKRSSLPPNLHLAFLVDSG